MLNAKSITYAGAGASRPHIERMVAALGIADTMTKKTILEPDSVRSAAKVAAGEAELLISTGQRNPAGAGRRSRRAAADAVPELRVVRRRHRREGGKPEAGRPSSRISGPGVAATVTAKGMERP